MKYIEQTMIKKPKTQQQPEKLLRYAGKMH